MTMELNIFNIVKQTPHKDKGIVDVDLIEELIYHTCHFNLNDDLVQTCLTHFGLNFNNNISINQVNALLHSSARMDIDNWKSMIEQLTPSEENFIPSSESSPKFVHNLLPNILEHAFLGEENNWQKSSHPTLTTSKTMQVLFTPFVVQKRDYSW